MKIYSIATRVLLGMLLCWGSQTVLAHNKLLSIVPEDGASVEHSPAVIQLNFADPTYLDIVVLESADGTKIPLDFTPASELASSYQPELPHLGDGTYTFHWEVEGSDTHRLKGTLHFTVKSK